MAIAGIVIGFLSMLAAGLIAVLVIVGLDAAEKGDLLPETAARDSSGQIEEARKISSMELRTGDCFMYPGADSLTEEVEEVGTVQAVPCTQAHDAQVFYVSPRLTGDRPSEDELTAQADKTCTTEGAKHLDEDAVTETMEIAFLYPTTTSWLLGERTIQCIVVEPKGGLTTSLVAGTS